MRMRDSVDIFLTPRGFSKYEEDVSGMSLGLYTTWKNEIIAIRIVWDVRDKWFRLEHCPVSRLKSFDSWIEFQHWLFQEGASVPQMDSIIEEMNRHLEQFFEK